MKKILLILHLPKTICNTIFGEDHPTSHRIIVGLLVAGGGVHFADMVRSLHNDYFSLAGDVAGNGIHAIGLTPIIEWLAKKTA